MSSIEPSRPSPRLGIFSVLVVLLPPLLCYGWLELASNVRDRTGSFVQDLVLAGMAVLVAIVGVILGLLSLRHKEQKRGFGIAGLAINALMLLPYLLLLIFVLAGDEGP